MKSKEEILEGLSQFWGTEEYHRFNMLSTIVMTDGAKYVADSCGAYWLMDKIAFSQSEKELRKQPFQVWKLTVVGSRGLITVEDGNGKVLYGDEVEYTDFPLQEIELWLMDGVILLKSEY